MSSNNKQQHIRPSKLVRYNMDRQVIWEIEKKKRWNSKLITRMGWIFVIKRKFCLNKRIFRKFHLIFPYFDHFLPLPSFRAQWHLCRRAPLINWPPVNVILRSRPINLLPKCRHKGGTGVIQALPHPVWPFIGPSSGPGTWLFVCQQNWRRAEGRAPSKNKKPFCPTLLFFPLWWVPPSFELFRKRGFRKRPPFAILPLLRSSSWGTLICRLLRRVTTSTGNFKCFSTSNCFSEYQFGFLWLKSWKMSPGWRLPSIKMAPCS